MPKTKKDQSSNLKPSKGVFLAETLIKEIKDVLAHYQPEQRVEMTQHLISVFWNVINYHKTRDENILTEFRNGEQELLFKYGKKFKPYHDKHFHKLFNLQGLLLAKGYYTDEEFKRLKGEDGELSQEDVSVWIARVLKYLHIDRYYSLMEIDPESEQIKALEIHGANEEQDEEMTEARQTLAIYYVLKAGFGIEARHGHDISKVARFAHLMSRRKITSVQNSSIYEKFKVLPYYKKHENLIEDLNFIRPFFEELDMQKILDLIDQELERAIQGLEPSKRKKYRSK